jgi:hypothetical protein
MARKRIDLPFPIGGRDDNISYGKQPPLTTPQAVNVRAIDRLTGRIRGGQRSGTSRIRTSGVGGRLQDLTCLAYDRPNITYTQLTDSVSNLITTAWSTSIGGLTSVQDAAVSPQGDVYVVTSQNTVTMYNPDGNLVSSVILPLDSALAQVRRIAVDQVGSAYVATNSPGIFAPARIHKLAIDEQGRLDLVWSTIAEGDVIVDMEWQDGILYTVEHVTWEEPESLVGAYAFLESDAPSNIWTRQVPHPASKLAPSSLGPIYVSCEPSAARGVQGDTGFVEGEIGWGPYEVASASTRLYSWVAADSDQEYRKFKEGWVLPDHRPSRNLESGSGLDIYDIRPRHLRGGKGFLDKEIVVGETLSGTSREVLGNVTTRKAARFDPKGFDLKPGLRFDPSVPLPDSSRFTDGQVGGRGLFSGPTTRLAFKSEDEDKLDAMATLWPMVDTDVVWMTSMIWRVADQSEPQIIAWQGHPGGMYIAVGTNATTTTPNITETPVSVPGNIYVDVGGEVCYGPYDSTTGVAIITIVCDEKTGAGSSEVWINGTEATGSPFIWPSTAWKTGRFRRTYFGTAASWDVHSTTRDVPSMDWGQADGWFGEMPTIFGTTTTTAHDTYSADDRESLEGYLSWKWGLGSGFLDATHSFDAAKESGTSGADFDNLNAALGDRRGQVVKVSPDYGAAVWVQAFESGAGYGVLADSEDGIISIGPRSSTKSDDDYSPLSITVRKFRDEGAQANAGTAAKGTIQMGTSPIGETPPTHNSVLTINDGVRDVDLRVDSNVGATNGQLISVGPPRVYRWTCGPTPINNSTAIANLVSLLDTLRQDTTNFSPDGFRIFCQARTIDSVGVDEQHIGDLHLIDLAADGTEALDWDAGEISGDITTTDFSSGAPHPAGCWAYRVDDANNLQASGVRGHVDSEDDIYVPWAPKTRTERGQLRKLDKTGSTLPDPVYSFDVGADSHAFSLAADPFEPLYYDSSVSGPEFVYITLDDAQDAGTAILRKLKLVDTDTSNAAVRAHKYVAVSGGQVYTFDRSVDPTAVSGSTMSASSIYVQSTVAFNRLYWTDGTGYFQYDPIDDAVSAWTSAKSGALPKRAKLIATWNGRIVLARAADDPYNWYMSGIGDAEDWDFFPKVPSLSQAISGGQARTGINRDIVNALIPYNDDLLIIGGDHTVQRLTGDPMAGGQIDLVSDQTGIAFGRAWTKDPEGNLYFFGSRGGVYAMAPGGVPQDISRSRIERSLREINLSDYFVRLLWNDYDNGLHVYFVRANLTSATTTRHWFWDRKSDSWWEDEFSSTILEPTAVAILDGDSFDDRVVAIGGEDGFIRRVDKDANSDDAGSGAPVRIYSKVLVGPIASDRNDSEVMFHNWEFTLAPTLSGVTYRIYQSDDPQVLGDALRQGSLRAGKNPPLMDRAVGSAVWIELANGSIGEGWAYDGGAVWASMAGRKRART